MAAAYLKENVLKSNEASKSNGVETKDAMALKILLVERICIGEDARKISF